MTTQDDIVAALNGHEITDDEGQIVENETLQEPTTTPEEQTTVDETATVEKPAETEPEAPAEGKESENEPEMVELAADETGKRYVPKDRFDKVYGKMKSYERELKTKTPPAVQPRQPIESKPIDKADALEIEMLRTQMPQFNPESPDYSPELDELGFSIYESSKDSKGNYTMTRLDAGRRAIGMAKKITSKVAEIKSEALSAKSQQSDQGITNRVLNREATKVDPMKMTLEEKEEWLKATGNW